MGTCSSGNFPSVPFSYCNPLSLASCFSVAGLFWRAWNLSEYLRIVLSHYFFLSQVNVRKQCTAFSSCLQVNDRAVTCFRIWICSSYSYSKRVFLVILNKIKKIESGYAVNGVLGFHLCLYSTSAVVLTVGSYHLLSIWITELQP